MFISAAIGYCFFRQKPTDDSNIPVSYNNNNNSYANNNANANANGYNNNNYSAHNSVNSVNSNTNMIAQQVGYNAQGQAVYAVQQNPINSTGTGTATRNTAQATRTTGAAALYMNNEL